MKDSIRERSEGATPLRARTLTNHELQTTHADPSHERQLGGAVGRYLVLDELGCGGMGRVIRAYDPKLQREVAVKEVHPDLADERAAERLVAEARAMAKLSHRNVVGIYDVEMLDNGNVVLVMEYVPGQDLRAWLEEGHPWKEVLARFIEAGRGLVAAHAAGLLHRDFKPANVLVNGPDVKVTDFGLAKAPVSHAGGS
ncbi:MAG: serine/threonine protein kinase, partial [Deltaproteobacteria bacterium]|nr:serine/threonine protein kinase [Deltaproteobacteria bacterium]